DAWWGDSTDGDEPPEALPRLFGERVVSAWVKTQTKREPALQWSMAAARDDHRCLTGNCTADARLGLEDGMKNRFRWLTLVGVAVAVVIGSAVHAAPSNNNFGSATSLVGPAAKIGGATGDSNV